MLNKDIIRIRKKLDKLDNHFLNMIKRRTKLVDEVLANKKFKNISKKSKEKKIDPKITNKIWRSMISAFIDYEFRNFRKK